MKLSNYAADLLIDDFVEVGTIPGDIIDPAPADDINWMVADELQNFYWGLMYDGMPIGGQLQ